MKKILGWLKANLGIIKVIFLISVVSIIIRELMIISQTFSYAKIMATMGQVPLWKIAFMLVIGLVAVLPMVGYDYLLTQSLQQKVSLKYLLKTSWVVNSINNVAGFGGVISIGLRSSFYGKNQDAKVVTQMLSKIFLFIMSGLSIYSFFGLLIVWFSPGHQSYAQQYWPWLLGGSLYFPVVLFLNSFYHKTYIGKVNYQEQLFLILTSFLEWTGVFGSFVLIGRLMGVSFQVSAVLPLFIAASVIGIVSMIPGAIGSFDIMMLISLSALGVQKEVAASWLLLYRLFYYLVPFLISLPIFVQTTGSHFNEKYDGVPKEISQKFIHKLSFVGFYIFGILFVVTNTMPEWFQKYQWFNQFHVSRIQFAAQLPTLIIGTLFLLIGRVLAAKVARAYPVAMALLFGTIIYCYFTQYGEILILILILLGVFTYLSRQELIRRQLVYAWEWMTIDFSILATLAISYSYIAARNMESVPEKHHYAKILSFFILPIERLFLYSFLLVAILIVTHYFLIRYFQGEKERLGEAFDEKKVTTILQTYGGNLNSQLVFLKDKRIFVYEQEGEATVFFQFAICNNKCIVMGDPSGKKEDFPAALEAIINQADCLGYSPVFYEVSESFVFILHEYGYEFFKMGEEAQVYLPDFSLSGKKMKGTRALINRLEKTGTTFEVVQPPYSAEFLAELHQISNAWLGSRKEKGFSLGFFAEDYLQRSEIAIVRNETGKIVAFANLMPAYEEKITTIDLMRHHPQEAPAGSMDFLFIHLFQWSQEQGMEYFSLGMAPLANVGVFQKSFLQERVAHLVYRFGSRFYSFEGLRKYKAKYATRWLPSYLLYHRENWILYVMIALLVVDMPQKKKK